MEMLLFLDKTQIPIYPIQCLFETIFNFRRNIRGKKRITMNVDKSTQLELLLITRTLDIISTTPGLSVAHFFDDFIQAISEKPESSLSAYWKQVYEKRSSLVEAKGADEKDGVESIAPGIVELDYLRSTMHPEIRHDPLLIIRKMYETASTALLSSNTEEKAILLYSCLIIAAKSARVSLFTHTVALLYIFKEESLGIKVKILKNIVRRAKELLEENKNSRVAQEINPRNASRSDFNDSRNGLVLSFGKADHGRSNFFIIIWLLNF